MIPHGLHQHPAPDVTRPRLHKPIAWLAFAAMWLLVAAPPISQVLAAAPVMAMADGAMHCDEHAGHGGDASPHPSSLDKCGYCDLLGHSPVVSSVAWLPPATPPSPYRLPWFLSAPRTSRTLLLSAAPRGPPADLNA
nr:MULTISPECIES: DUF2946 domain-containing protein [unclassified Dyella]